MILTKEEVMHLRRLHDIEEGEHFLEFMDVEFEAFAAAIEAKVIEKIKAQGRVVLECKESGRIALETTHPQNYYPLYRLPEEAA